MKSQKQKRSLVVVAHPDDESLFFGGLVLSRPKIHWDLICVTSVLDPKRALERKAELKKAVKRLGFKKVWHWDFPDIFDQRLDVEAITKKMQDVADYSVVYTHGPLGEYGHPHHQDVSLAVHKGFHGRARVKSVAFNCAPLETVVLSPKVYQKKMKTVLEVYREEFQKFPSLLPVSYAEGFDEVPLTQIQILYGLLTKKVEMNQKEFSKKCPRFAHLYPEIVQGWLRRSTDGFFKSYFSPVPEC